MDKNTKYISQQMVTWYRDSARALPWRETTDPYAIWVSEIILQQTTVAQGTAYYERFLKAFPTIADLAAAPQDEVLKLWEGLGYYSRARNIHHSAKDIMDRFGGVFPSTYKDILSLKGIGPYAAAAIGSFAFGLPHVVVDGNVLRVISRLYAIEASVDLPATKKQVQVLAQQLLEQQDPAEFNQTIMEFGAMLCTYKHPSCMFCPLNKNCQAFNKGLVSSLPLKTKKIKKKNRYFHYYLQEDKKGQVAIIQRTAKDIWNGLYQLPMVESADKDADILHDKSNIAADNKWEASKWYKQTLTHQYIHARFYHYKVSKHSVEAEAEIVKINALKNYAWPRIINHYLADKGII